MSNVIEKVEEIIQNAILAAMGNNITPRVELTVRLINASSGRDAASVTTNSQRGEQVGITTSFENVSDRNNKSHEVNVNDETREYIPDELSDL